MTTASAAKCRAKVGRVVLCDVVQCDVLRVEKAELERPLAAAAQCLELGRVRRAPQLQHTIIRRSCVMWGGTDMQLGGVQQRVAALLAGAVERGV